MNIMASTNSKMTIVPHWSINTLSTGSPYDHTSWLGLVTYFVTKQNKPKLPI
jgi:hypothetical protein